MHRVILATITVAILSASLWAQAQGSTTSTTAPAHSKKAAEGKSGAKDKHHKHHHKK